MLSEELAPLRFLTALPDDFTQNLIAQGSCEVNAVLIGNEINLKALTNRTLARKESVFVSLSDKSVAIIYPYGAIVFFNATTSTTVGLITRCQSFVNQLLSTPETEQFTMLYQPDQLEGVIQGKISIRNITKEHLEIISAALSKSVVLEYHENRIGSLFDKIEPIAKSLKDKGTLGHRANDLLKHIGASILMVQETVGKIEVTEKPLLLWEHTELETLHAQLVEDLEIIDRQKYLERKIGLISSTAQISLEVLQQHHSHRLEYYIIILIAIEIFLHVYDMFFSTLG